MSFINADGYEPAPGISSKGVYYTIRNNPAYYRTQKSIECLFFYEDGTCGYLSNALTEADETVSLDSLCNHLMKYAYLARWGYYSLNKDTIHATLYIDDSQRMGNIPEEWQMVIKGEHKIDVLKTMCDRCKGQYSEYGANSTITFKPVKGYQLLPSVLKPDSSQARIRKKKWFQKKLNSSGFDQ